MRFCYFAGERGQEAGEGGGGGDRVGLGPCPASCRRPLRPREREERTEGRRVGYATSQKKAVTSSKKLSCTVHHCLFVLSERGRRISPGQVLHAEPLERGGGAQRTRNPHRQRAQHRGWWVSFVSWFVTSRQVVLAT